MPYTDEVVKVVSEAFEEKRRRAYEEAEKRRAEVYEKVSGIREIDGELQKTGLKVYAEALKPDKSTLDERIEALHGENRELQAARAAILMDAGYPADYTRVRFTCPDCADTGYIGIKPCPCMIRALRRESYRSSGLGRILEDQSFDNFDVSLYPEEDRRMMTFIRDEAKKFAEAFGDEKKRPENLLFFGGTGLGKTHLSTAIAKTVIDRGFSVVYDSAVNVMHAFEKERFAKEAPDGGTEKYFECDLFILDDLGSEFMSSFTHATLYNLLNTRIYAGKSTIVSTNLEDAEGLKRTYDERVVSRLVGEFRTFHFTGKDIRLEKRRNNR